MFEFDHNDYYLRLTHLGTKIMQTESRSKFTWLCRGEAYLRNFGKDTIIIYYLQLLHPKVPTKKSPLISERGSYRYNLTRLKLQINCNLGSESSLGYVAIHLER
jgi:hypothetical protein